jgi:hypothetical protein
MRVKVPTRRLGALRYDCNSSSLTRGGFDRNFFRSITMSQTNDFRLRPETSEICLRVSASLSLSATNCQAVGRGLSTRSIVWSTRHCRHKIRILACRYHY